MVESGKKEIHDLEEQIESLKSELAASLEREAILLNPKQGTTSLKERIKKSKFGRVIADPDSSIGKIIRLPRTIYRLLLHPKTIKELITIKRERRRLKKKLFVPIRFFEGANDERRLNLVLKKIDEEKLKIAIELANKEDVELRVITYGEGVATIKYNELVTEKKIPKCKRISFYSSVDQLDNREIFELEVGENDLFLTTTWK